MANSSSASNTSTNTSSGSQNSSNTSESKSNGNFSGGSLNSGTSFSFGKGSSLSSEPGYAHGDFSLAGNLGWTPSISLNGSSSGKSSNMFTGATYDSSTGQTSYNTSYVSGSGSPSSSSSSSTTVTVDDVFGTGATTIDVGKFNPDNKVEAKTQGDYEASKETKSDVSTNTFGKQEEITVTPESVTENKGLASNQVIDSVEGLAKTQKDKESQEVLDASKKRGEAEEADVSNKMRDNLKAAGQVEDETENVNKFQIGEDDIDRAASKNIQAAKDKADELQTKADEIKNSYDIINKQVDSLKAESEKTEDAYTEAKDDVLVGHSWAGDEEAYNKYPDKFEGYIDINSSEIYQYRGTDTVFESKVDKANNAFADWQATVNDYEQKATYMKDLAKKYDAAQKDANKYRSELDAKLSDIQGYADKLRSEVSRIQQGYQDGTLDASKAMQQLEQLGLMAGTGDFGFSTSDLVYLAGGLDGKYLSNNPSELQASYVGSEEAPAVVEEQEDNYKSLYKEINEKTKEAAAYNKAMDKIEENILEYLGFDPIFNDTEAKKAGISYEEVPGIVDEDGEQATSLMFVYKGTDEKLKSLVNEHNRYRNLSIEAWTETYELQRQANDAKKLSEIQASYVGSEEAPAVVEETPTIQESQEAFNTAKEAITNSANTEEAAAANEIISKVEETQADLATAIDTIEKAGGLEKANPADIEAWVNAQKEYNKNIDEALKASNAFTQTDFNKEFTRSIALANDFEVTLADGTKTTYSQFTTDMVTKSPQIAAAMYQAKAQRYEEQHHKFLAAVENKKAEMMSQPGFFNALGRSLLGADNQVRDQFTKMAEANMRATYATYNNVLNNPNATDEQKTEARAQIAQANSLMQASTVLKASTGLLTGLGDSMTDGVYGVTEAKQLNGFQDFAAKFGMATQAIMGLAVTPAANKAYQKALYLNPEDNGFFTRDFDNDGFALCQEYGNNAAAELVGCGTELVAGVALCFNPTTLANGLNLVYDAIRGSVNAVYGVRKRAESAELATNKVLEYFKTAEELKGLPTEVKDAIDQGIAGITEGTEQIEDFELKSDEVGNLNNWLEGSGSNTASNDKFNQSLSYDEWLKLIESDETMRNYAKKLTENAKKSDVDTGVNA